MTDHAEAETVLPVTPSTAAADLVAASDAWPVVDEAGPRFAQEPFASEQRLELERLAVPFHPASHVADCPASAVQEEVHRGLQYAHLAVLSCADRLVHRACLSQVPRATGSTWLEIPEAVVIDPSAARERDEPRRTSAPGQRHLDTHVGESATLATAVDLEGGPLTVENLANARHGHEHAVVIVWAMTAETAPILRVLQERDDAFVRGLQQRLAEANLTVIILTRDDHLPLDEAERARRRRRRDLRRELETLGRVQPATTLDQACAGLQKLLQDMFGSQELHAFVREAFPGEENDLPLLHASPSGAALAGELVQFLRRRNLTNDALFDRLVRRRPEYAERIRRCRQDFAEHHGDIATLRDRIQLERERSDPGTAEAIWAVRLVEIDAIAAMLHRRLDRRQMLGFELQRRDGRWGAHDADIVQALRNCISAGLLLPSLEGTAGEARPSELPASATLGDVDLLVLFIAAFLPDLDPDEFEAVLRGLLESEQQHLERLRTADGSADDADAKPSGAPRTLEQEWAGDADVILKRCHLYVREDDQGERRRLLLSWKDPQHGQQWKEWFRSTRHYFATRQLDHLKRFGFLSLVIASEEAVFGKILELQLEHARLSPARHAGRWLEQLSEVVGTLLEALLHGQIGLLGASTRESTELANRRAWVARLANEQHKVQRRLGSVLVAIQQDRQLRGFVAAFLNQLIGHDAVLARQWALGLVRRLADAAEFDQFHWLGQLYARGEWAHTRPGVIRTLAERCFSRRTETRLRAWEAVTRWLPASVDGFAANKLCGLGFYAAMEVLMQSTVDASQSSGVDDALSAWARSPEAPAPAPVLWLMDPTVAALCELHHARAADSVLERMLGEQWLPAELVRQQRDVFRRELLLRFEEELCPSEGVRQRCWAPLLIAGVLVLWIDRLAQGGAPEDDASSLVPRMLGATRLADVALTVSGVLTAFQETLSAFSVVDATDVQPKLQAHSTRIARAIDRVRGPLDHHLVTAGRSPDA